MLRVYWDSRRWVRLQSEKAMEDEGSLDTTTRLPHPTSVGRRSLWKSSHWMTE